MDNIKDIYIKLRTDIYAAIDAATIENLSKEQLEHQLSAAIDILVEQKKIHLPAITRSDFVQSISAELIGLGPLQTLMEDDTITDIMVNGPNKVFIERNGLIELSNIHFIDEQQLQSIAKRIASGVGRRVDEANPLCDARLKDGSRVNIVLPVLSIDGTAISIRKFREKSIRLTDLVGFGAMSEEMASVLMVAAHCRLNILISGSTGSGKTTLLNALTQYISENERIITIEDAAELRLQQPHVIRLETRTAGIENTGAVDQRQLVINSLRMRPDRVIIGECRGGEAFEMLQAMNTGHDGSMSTLHANTPRDAVARVESMVMMSSSSLPIAAIRQMIVSATDLIIQVNRLHDGSRKVTSISEVVGLEGDKVVLDEIFCFRTDTQQQRDKVVGRFTTAGIMERSVLMKKARFFGLDKELKETFAKVGQ
jgi:pilus assembly protein CpaF